MPIARDACAYVMSCQGGPWPPPQALHPNAVDGRSHLLTPGDACRCVGRKLQASKSKSYSWSPSKSYSESPKTGVRSLAVAAMRPRALQHM